MGVRLASCCYNCEYSKVDEKFIYSGMLVCTLGNGDVSDFCVCDNYAEVKKETI